MEGVTRAVHGHAHTPTTSALGSMVQDLVRDDKNESQTLLSCSIQHRVKLFSALGRRTLHARACLPQALILAHYRAGRHRMEFSGGILNELKQGYVRSQSTTMAESPVSQSRCYVITVNFLLISSSPDSKW
jgi:hypothetical protein